jgi:D-alanine---D-serine ligase
MEKYRIAVLFGGCSPEYEISLQSAYSVITHIDKTKYDPILLGITQSGEWFCYSGAPEKIKNDTWNNPADCVKAIISPDRKTNGVLIFDNNSPRSIRLDAAMPVLHGKHGEDGTVQGLLELAGIPVIGCKTLASALCMDKDKAHKIAAMAGIKIPRSFTLKNNSNKKACFEQARKLGFPLFVKPVKAGSSYGITKVLCKNELPAAVKLAFEYDSEIIVEENIPGFEIGCAVLGNDSLSVGMLDEIEIADGFFNYKEKYTLETSSIHVPARLSEEKAEEAKETAKAIYKALGCTGFARVDMFITPSGEIVFNEVNTIPGFTTHSRYPNMLKAVGIPFEEVINTVIELAVKK